MGKYNDWLYYVWYDVEELFCAIGKVHSITHTHTLTALSALCAMSHHLYYIIIFHVWIHMDRCDTRKSTFSHAICPSPSFLIPPFIHGRIMNTSTISMMHIIFMLGIAQAFCITWHITSLCVYARALHASSLSHHVYCCMANAFIKSNCRCTR